MTGSGSDPARALVDELGLLEASRTHGAQAKVFQILRDLRALGGTHVAEHLISTRDAGLKTLLGDFLSFTGGAGAREAFTAIFNDSGESEPSRARAAYHLGFAGDDATLVTLSRTSADRAASDTLRLGALAGVRSFFSTRPYDEDRHGHVLDALTKIAQLDDEPAPVRREAVRALGSLRTWRATESLVRVLRWVRYEWRSPDRRSIRTELGHVAIVALAESRFLDATVLDVLTRMYELDPEFKGAVVQALGTLHGKHHRPNATVSRDALDFLLSEVLGPASDDYLLARGAAALTDIGVSSTAIVDRLHEARRRATDRFTRKSIDDALAKLQSVPPR